MSKVIQVGDSQLPPAGDARREELKRRTDVLEEAAESTGVEGGTGPLPEVENELAQHFNELEVSNQDPSYAYCWVYTGQQGRMIRMKLAEGWEMVQGDMLEAVELKGMGGDTTRKLGDVVLMRIRRDRYLLLQRQRRERTRNQSEGVEAALREAGEKYKDRGLVVHTSTDTMRPEIVKRMANQATARTIADKTMDQRIREGRVPGMPAPGTK